MPAFQDRFKTQQQDYYGQLMGQLPWLQQFATDQGPAEAQAQALTPGLVSPALMDWHRQALVNAVDRGQGVAERMPEGYSPDEQRQIKAGAYSTTAAPFAAAGEELRRQAARTGSPTSLAPALAGFARQRGQALTDVAGKLPQMFHEALTSDLAQKAQMTLAPGQLAEQAKRGELAGFQPLLETAKLPMERFKTGVSAMSDFYKNILGSTGQLGNLAGIQAGKAGWGDIAKQAVGSWLNRPQGK